MISVVEDAEAEGRGRESERKRRKQNHGQRRREEQRGVGRAEPSQDSRRLPLKSGIANGRPPAALLGGEIIPGSRIHFAPEGGPRGKARYLADRFGRRLRQRRKLRRLAPGDCPGIFSRKTILPLERS